MGSEDREPAWVWKNGEKEEAEGQCGFKCPDLGIELGHAEECGSALTNVTPSFVSPSAMPAPVPGVIADVAGVRRALTWCQAMYVYALS